MDRHEILIDLYGRIDAHVDAVLDGLTLDELSWLPVDGPRANPIGWLIWHSARVIDTQIAELAGTDQVWVGGDWAAGFGLDPDPHNSGYGHSTTQVAAVRPRDTAVLGAYYKRCSEEAQRFLYTLVDDELDRVVDLRWDPPVTLGVRLISIADDAIQHAGAAAYLKGLLET